MEPMSAYRLQGVEARWGEFVLRVKDLHLPGGRIYSVTGPNGCGKTSLLRLLSLLDGPEKGRVRYGGAVVDYNDGAACLRSRRRIAYLMQHPYLFNMSVYDNIAYGLHLRNAASADVRLRVREVIERLALDSLARRKAHTLSGGEAQRVALARSLVLDADVMLLDEFTAGVDQRYVQRIEEYVRELHAARGATIVFTTHSSGQAARMSDHPITIANGCVAARDAASRC
jgi:tungstate transport system ATP-binding protein